MERIIVTSLLIMTLAAANFFVYSTKDRGLDNTHKLFRSQSRSLIQ